jgi:hypothetical protein
MVEISYLNNGTLGTASGTTALVGVPSTGTAGVPGTLYSLSQMFGAGLEAQSSIGTTAVAGSDLVPLSHGGSVYLATVSEMLSVGGSLPASAPLLSTNSGGTAVAVGLGPNLVSSGGSVVVSVPASTPLLGSTAGGSFSAVTLGPGLALSGGTLSATGTSYVAGIDIAISGNTISLAAPASAALLSTNVGGSLSALVLGSGLTESGGTINTVSSGGIELTDGTNTLTGVSEILVEGASVTGTSGAVGTLTFSGGSGTYSAGSNISISGTIISFNPAGLQVPISVWVPGLLSTNQVMWSAKFPFNLTIPANPSAGGLWLAESITNTATSNTTLTLTDGGSEVVYFAFSASGSYCGGSSVSGTAHTIAAGDRIQLLAPADPDASLAGIEVLMTFTR